MWSHLFIYFFVFVVQGDTLEEIYLREISEIVLSMSFMVPGLTFKFLSILNTLLYMMQSDGLVSFFFKHHY